jgi:hypothetical protein
VIDNPSLHHQPNAKSAAEEKSFFRISGVTSTQIKQGKGFRRHPFLCNFQIKFRLSETWGGESGTSSDSLLPLSFTSKAWSW